MAEDYDRLAWGLVKDEIRRLVKPREVVSFEDTLVKMMKIDQAGHYQNKGALSDIKLKRLRSDILSGSRSRLSAFGHSRTRARMEDQGGMMDIDHCFAWDFKEVGVIDPDNAESNRREKFLELRSLYFGISKRKFILDSMSCFIVVNQHTLYRMLQRGAISRNPLALLSEKLDDWANYAAMFMLSHKYLGNHIGNKVFIPFCGGALLGKIAITENASTDEGFNRHRLRIVDSIQSGHVGTIPRFNVLEEDSNGTKGNITLQISTWIPNDFFHGEQDWAEDQIRKFTTKHADIVAFSAESVFGSYNPTKIRNEEFAESAATFGKDLARIYSDRRWTTACQW